MTASCRGGGVADDLTNIRGALDEEDDRGRPPDTPSMLSRPSGRGGRLRLPVSGSFTSRIAWSKSMYCAARLPPEALSTALPQLTYNDWLPSNAASKRPSSVTAEPWPAIRLWAAREGHGPRHAPMRTTG